MKGEPISNHLQGIMGDISYVSKRGTLPFQWILKRVNPSKIDEVRPEYSFIREVYVTPDHYYVSVYKPAKEKQYAYEAAQFEFDALNEHLRLLGRSEDAAKLIYFESDNISIVAAPWLGKPLDDLNHIWYRQGRPGSSPPILKNEFHRLVKTAQGARYIPGDCGGYNIVIHPTKGPCLVDLTLPFSDEEQLPNRDRNLLQVARELIMPYQDLPYTLRSMISPLHYEEALANDKAFCMAICLSQPDKNNIIQALQTMGITTQYQTERFTVFFGKNEIYIHIPYSSHLSALITKADEIKSYTGALFQGDADATAGEILFFDTPKQLIKPQSLIKKLCQMEGIPPNFKTANLVL